MAMPFSGKEFTFTHPDGTKVQLRGWGNQYHAVFETLDGFSVIKDPQSGFYHYARLSADKSQLVSTAARVGEVNPRTLGVAPGLRIPRAVARERALEAKSAEGLRRWEVRLLKKRAALRGLAQKASPEGFPPDKATVGNYVGLCLIIDFPDMPATIPQQEVDDFCNKPGYRGHGNNGSVRDYFREVSGNKLNYTNRVTSYYTTRNAHAYYVDPSVPFGVRAAELIREALDALVASGFDFSGLSSDEENYIYALNVFYAGPRVNGWSEGLWPHAWRIVPYAVGDKQLSDYQITNMGSQLSLGTFCHENGHMLCSFPDLYDYGAESQGAGSFCLMAFGGGDEQNPAQVGAYLKNAAGWASTFTRLRPGLTVSLKAGANDFALHSKNTWEYFIIENRQQTGRDQSLPDGGLAIWHVDEFANNSNEAMTADAHYECSLEQADGRFDLERNNNWGDSEDLFGGPSKTRFNQDTNPGSRWWDGSASGLDIQSISAPGPIMTFTTPREKRPLNPGVYQLLLLD